MPYMDIWMYNSRPRMRVFLCYFLIFITFFIFSDIMIYLYTKSLYKPMEDGYMVLSVNPQITVTTAESSNQNGNVKGTIKNNTNETIENQYIRFDFYTPRYVNVGTKYLKVEELEPDEEKEYEVGFRYENVESVKITTVDESEVENATADEFEISPVITTAGLLGGILWSYIIF